MDSSAAPVCAVEILPCCQAKTTAHVCSRIFFLWMGNRLMCDLYSFFLTFICISLPFQCFLCGVFALSLDVGDASCDRSKLCPATLLPLLLSNLAWGGPIPPENHDKSVPENKSLPSIASKFGRHVLKLFLNIFCPCRCAEVKVAVLQEVPFKNGIKQQKKTSLDVIWKCYTTVQV